MKIISRDIISYPHSNGNHSAVYWLHTFKANKSFQILSLVRIGKKLDSQNNQLEERILSLLAYLVLSKELC